MGRVNAQVNPRLLLLLLLSFTAVGPTSGQKNVLMFAIDDLRGAFGESYNASWIKVCSLPSCCRPLMHIDILP